MNVGGTRRCYKKSMVVNGRCVDEIEIDTHYELRHPDITDDVILQLVGQLDRLIFHPDRRRDDWAFFVFDRMELEGKWYRLVWCMQDGESFIGVINCFKRG